MMVSEEVFTYRNKRVREDVDKLIAFVSKRDRNRGVVVKSPQIEKILKMPKKKRTRRKKKK